MGALSRFGEDCASGGETNVPISPDEAAAGFLDVLGSLSRFEMIQLCLHGGDALFQRQ